jgi:endonuclease/exonuclease/phosphatase family metal-dependent hydrolase
VQTSAPSFAGVLLSVALVTAPILIIDFTRLSRALIAARRSLPALGAAFGLSALYLLVMIFAQVFTTVYDYIPVVGPFFRDRFWLVYLLPGLVLVLALLRTPPGGLLPGAGAGRFYPAALTLLGAAVVMAAWVTASRPAQAVEKEPLRVLTYNIQQGYRADGQRGAVDQLELLRQVDADLIGLQESDTARISGGNADLVRYFADRLDLYSYYGPRTVTGTFGIALLSRYPIENPRTFYMYSTGEQTAAIAAEVTAGGQTYNVFVTHLGNGGPLIQQEQVLAEIDGLPNVIAMGDFNFEPTTEQYRLTTAQLADAWLLKWPSGTGEDGNNPADRIDHIFLSPGMTVSEAQHIDSPASDHPAVWIEIMP